jgi:hypothetical protein
MTLPRLLDSRAAADALAVTPACLDAWRRRGRGPRWCQVGRLIRYSETDLESFLADATRGPGAQRAATTPGLPNAEDCDCATCRCRSDAESDRGKR